VRARRPPGLAGLPVDRPPLRHGRPPGASPPSAPTSGTCGNGRPLPATGRAPRRGGRGRDRSSRERDPRRRTERRRLPACRTPETARPAESAAEAGMSRASGERDASTACVTERGRRRGGRGTGKGEEVAAAVGRFGWRRWFRPRPAPRGGRGGLKKARKKSKDFLSCVRMFLREPPLIESVCCLRPPPLIVDLGLRPSRLLFFTR